MCILSSMGFMLLQGLAVVDSLRHVSSLLWATVIFIINYLIIIKKMDMLLNNVFPI